MDNPISNSLSPAEIAENAIKVGIKKAKMDPRSQFLLSILAGVFIAFGAIFSTAISAGATNIISYGSARLLAGLGFTVGLILVVVGGAELFTGNMLMTIAYANKQISLSRLLRNWGIVYSGNFIGSIIIAGLVLLGRQYAFGSGAIGLNMLVIGEAKTSLSFFQAFSLGILCNILVCMAVWMAFSAKDTGGKILAIIMPIATFVAAGFEHSVANMYFIPAALFVKFGGDPSFFNAIGKSPADFPHLTWQNFFAANLLPVTLGNMVGGALFISLVYWYVYVKKNAGNK